jgi:hypothetical protein
MHHLYLILKDREEPPTEEEKEIAAGKKTLDQARAAEYLVEMEKASTGIVNLFNQQHQHAAVCFYHQKVHLTHHSPHRSKIGIRKSSSNSSQIGSLLVTSPLTKLRNPSFGISSNIPTCGRLSEYPTVGPSKNALCRWVKIRSKE